MTNLGLRPEHASEPPPERGRGLLAAVLLLFLALAALGWVAYLQHARMRALDQQMAALAQKADQSSALARQALERAVAAEGGARAAAEGRHVAETQSEAARQQADAALQDASTAREAAARAEAEAKKVRDQAEADVKRLEGALGQIADTRRTALGLVMNLGSDHLKFEFNKADLRPGDRELLARVAGILTTAHDYKISVNGYTDDVGSADYNLKLSARRAQAVRDYFVAAGLPEDMFTVEGYGKARPLVPGTSEQARAKNRRVELGIVNTQIKYQR